MIVTMDTLIGELLQACQSLELVEIFAECMPNGIGLSVNGKKIKDLGPRTAYNTMISWNLILREAGEGRRILYPLYARGKNEKYYGKRAEKLFYFGPYPERPCVIILPGDRMKNISLLDSDAIPIAVEVIRLGYNAAVFPYWLGSEEIMPARLEKLGRAIDICLQNQSQYGNILPEYAVFGFGAGGYLAGLWGTVEFGSRKFLRPEPGIIVCASALFSTGLLHETIKCGMTSKAILEEAERQLFHMIGENYTYEDVLRYSVPEHIDKNYPPVYLIHGKRDEKVSIHHSEQMVYALSMYRIPHLFRSVPDAEHHFGKGYKTSADGWIEEALAFWKNC